jgi:hypothetical protein
LKKLSKKEKERRIIKSVIPASARGEVLRKAIHDLHVEWGRVCGGCGEWPEYCCCLEKE